MSDVVRFSVSTEQSLLERFDTLIAEKGYVNRSEAIRDLIRTSLIDDALASEDCDAVGTVTLVYDHHRSDLSDRLTQHQHAHHESIISALHIHLDHHTCLEVVILRGRAAVIRRLADSLIGTKGVTHGRFVATVPSGNLA